MLSRRNIRIKILQVLYMMGRDKEVKADDAMTYYRKSLERSQDLYLFNLLSWMRVAEFAVEDLERKGNKYLPKDEDVNFSAKLWENPMIQAMVSEEDFLKICEEKGFADLLNADTLRNHYKGFAATEAYKEYVYQQKGPESDREILLSLYRYLAKDETYEEDMEDQFPTWEDDKSLVVGAMKKTIKSLPDTPSLYQTFRPDYEASVEFGEKMLQKVIEEDDKLVELIEPALQNWDMDRVAAVDLILLKMAISEFLYCPTIPTRVTLNEYVELAKLYSTDKSKEFINGILDRMMKKLEDEGKIVKSGRGLAG